MGKVIHYAGADLYPKQRAAIFDPARISVIAAGTKCGKTIGALAWLAEKAMVEGRQDRNYWWCAPVFGQAEIAFRRLKARLPRSYYKANQSKLTISLVNGATIWFKSSERSDDLYGEDVYAVVMDEACFAAGSLVDTPDGPFSIERLRAGAKVLTAAGVQEIVAVRQTTRDAIAVVTVAERSVVCSVDHPFFTARGWVFASELTEEDQIASCDQGMRILRDRVLCDETCRTAESASVLLADMLLCGDGGQAGDASLPLVPKRVHLPAGTTADPAFLHALLCCEVEAGAAGVQGKGLHAGASHQDVCQSETLVGERRPYAGSAARTNHQSQTDARSSKQSEGLRDTQATRAPAAVAGWQRAGHERPAGALVGQSRNGLEVRVGRGDRYKGGRGTKPLDDRHSRPDSHDRGRGGWRFAPEQEGQGTRCSQGPLFGFVRVESVAVHKSGSAEFASYSAGADRITLYDLEVAGHPAFSVEGLLVHNSRMREESWHAIRSTLTFTQGPVRMIGNVKGRKNWFYQLGELAQRGTEGMAYHKITCWDAVEAGVLDRSEIEAAERDFKRLGREGAFRQLYLAEAAADGDNPFGLAAIEACIVAGLSAEYPKAAGVDLAGRGAINTVAVAAEEVQARDYTAIVLLDGDGTTTYIDRFRKPHTETATEIRRVVKNTMALVDSTGTGDAVVEALQRTGNMRVEGFTFTDRSRQDLLEGLALRIGEEAVHFPDGYLRDELDSFEFRFERRGIRYAVPEGMHDDTSFALALAVKRLPWSRRHHMTPTGVAKPGGSTWTGDGDPVREAGLLGSQQAPDPDAPAPIPVPVSVGGSGVSKWSGAG